MKIPLCLCLALGFALQPMGAAAAADPLNDAPPAGYYTFQKYVRRRLPGLKPHGCRIPWTRKSGSVAIFAGNGVSLSVCSTWLPKHFDPFVVDHQGVVAREAAGPVIAEKRLIDRRRFDDRERMPAREPRPGALCSRPGSW